MVRNARSPLVMLACAGIVMLIGSALDHDPLVVWNTTPSVDIGLYWISAAQPRRREIAAVRLPPDVATIAAQRGYLPRGAVLLKPVAAVAGNRICRWGLRIVIDGAIRATAAPRDRLGRHLPDWRGCRTLAAGEIAVLATSPDSFDSRYFGPLSRAQIVGRAVPAWNGWSHQMPGAPNAGMTPRAGCRAGLRAMYLLWCSADGALIALTGPIKKTQQTPAEEIAIALACKSEYEQ